MNMISQLIKSAQIELDTSATNLEPPELPIHSIPTLEKGVYKTLSPMLQERFKLFGHWLEARLSLAEMQALWGNVQDARLAEIKAMQVSASEHWEDEVSSLFRKNRLSLFAGSADTNEKIYLLWLDSKIEPEIWVYDTNGEARYANLAEYLIAYLADDLLAYERSWKLSNK